jgi:hypothetical protein
MEWLLLLRVKGEGRWMAVEDDDIVERGMTLSRCR